MLSFPDTPALMVSGMEIRRELDLQDLERAGSNRVERSTLQLAIQLLEARPRARHQVYSQAPKE